MGWLSSVFGFFRSFQFWVTIAPWECGLRVRLGKTATVLNPGPHLRIPFLDRIFVQPVRLRAVADNGQTVMTKDGKSLSLGIAVMYQIDDIKKLHMAVANPETTLLNLVQGLLAEAISIRTSIELTPKLLEDEVSRNLPTGDIGMTNARLIVRTFAYCRVLRLLNHEYQTTSKTNELKSSTDVE